MVLDKKEPTKITKLVYMGVGIWTVLSVLILPFLGWSVNEIVKVGKEQVRIATGVEAIKEDIGEMKEEQKAIRKDIHRLERNGLIND